MLRQDKEQVVAELVERFRTSDTLLLADYRGLAMTEIDDVRTELLKHGARFSVVKNTLTRRAAEAAGVEGLLEFLEGPTAIAFVGDGDMVAVAKTLNETARQTRILTLKGGILQGQPITADEVRDLATLPSTDVLQGQIVGAIIGPLNAIVGLFTAPVREFVGVIDARIRQLEEGDTATADVGPGLGRPAEADDTAEGPPPGSATEQPPPDDEQPEAPGSAEDQQTPTADATEAAAAEAQENQAQDQGQEEEG